jgi:hypothetical protein
MTSVWAGTVVVPPSYGGFQVMVPAPVVIAETGKVPEPFSTTPGS